MSAVRSLFVMAVPAVLVGAVAIGAGAHAATSAPQAVSLAGSSASGATVSGATVSGATVSAGAVTDEVSWSRLCGRVGTALGRARAAATRMDGGGDTKGSSARLQARLDAATKAGDADRIRVLTDLSAIRRSHASTVGVRIDKLGDIQQVCHSHSS